MKYNRISIDPEIMVGKPCIAGTRITVEHILRLLAGGMTVADVVRGHPRLTTEDVGAAQAFAADVLASPDVRRRLAEEHATSG